MSIFTSIPKKRQKRSNFNLSHDVKLSLDMGYVVPTYLQEVLPGDTTKISTAQMLRLAPLISPVMHRINVYTEFFFVPNRILWDNWETFITGSRNGKQLPQEELPVVPFVQPYSENRPNHVGSLMDYFGVPTPNDFEPTETPSNTIGINSLPFAAYQKIWDEYYRDENLIESLYDVLNWPQYDKIPDDLDETDQQQLMALRPRCWEHDYFTTALPWAQKGEAVQIPIDLRYDEDDEGPNFGSDVIRVKDGTYTPPLAPNFGSQILPTSGHTGLTVENDQGNQVGVNLVNGTNYENRTTINDLRAAIKLQEWLETNARGGSRYFESIYAHFGVKSPDSRLQRPEFIGSDRSTMVISEVLQTSSPQTENDTPQGNMSGHGSSVSSSKTFSYHAQEHGFIIGMISIMPRTAYQQGIPKLFNKVTDRLDYYFPEFAHLGEQEIFQNEIYAGGSGFNDTFGYTPRYAEYKFINSRVAGDFRDTLRFWHLGRYFEDAPQLNDAFVGSGTSISKRIFAVQDIPQDGSEVPSSIRDYHTIYGHVFHDVNCSRLMPKYGTPTL